MQATDFITKWSPGASAHALNERAGAQAHFIDLCRVLGVPEPGDPDSYCFERGLTKTGSTGLRTDGALIPADLPAAVRPQAEAIARAAARLVALRDAWLNPHEWTERVPEVVPLGMDHSPYPDRIVARPGFERELAKRTLTNLYNQRPAWLAQAHAALDAAVATAYGWADWSAAMPDDEILRRLLALNRERAGT